MDYSFASIKNQTFHARIEQLDVLKIDGSRCETEEKSLKYSEFKRQVAKAGLSLKEFSKLIKQSPTSISNYAKTDVVPSQLAIIAVLFAEMKERGIDYQGLIDALDLFERKPRGRANKMSKESQSVEDQVTSEESLVTKHFGTLITDKPRE